MKKLFVGTAVLATVILIGSGCTVAREQKESATDKGVIKIGVLAPYSGDEASYGETVKGTINLAAKDIKNQGGIDGKDIKIIFEDGHCNGKDAASAMQKLAQVDKVNYVIGGFCSGESLAAAPIANQNSIVLFSGSSSNPKLTTEGGKFFLRNYPSDDTQGVVLANAAYDDRGWRRIGILQEQTDYAEGLAGTFKENFTKKEGEILLDAFTSDETDFRTILSKFKAAEVDALFLSIQNPRIADLIIKQTNELGWEPGLIGSDVFAGFTEVLTKHADSLQGIILAEFSYDSENAQFKKMRSDYVAEHGAEPEFLSYATTVYDALRMLADAIEEAGDDPEAVLAWLLNSKGWKGVSGVVEFTPEGDRAAGHELKTVDKYGNIITY